MACFHCKTARFRSPSSAQNHGFQRFFGRYSGVVYCTLLPKFTQHPCLPASCNCTPVFAIFAAKGRLACENANLRGFLRVAFNNCCDMQTARLSPRPRANKKKRSTDTNANVLRIQTLMRRASCRIRTNDPEITNHVLWPTELKRRVGKLLASRGQATCIAPLQPTTFATFPSWRIRRELAVQDLPVFKRLQR